MQKNATVESMNEVIARFIGMELKHDKDDPGFEWEWVNGPDKSFWPSKTPPPYHTSWDWLVPVIQKIKGIHLDILKQSYVMDYMKAASHMNSGLISLKIEEAHLGVYKFLTWYNENQQKQNDE